MQITQEGILLYALFAGAIPLGDPRVDLNTYSLSVLLDEVSQGNADFDRFVLQTVLDRDPVLFDAVDLSALWSAINASGEFPEGLKKVENAFREALQRSLVQQKDVGDAPFLESCVCACQIPTLKEEVLKLLELNHDLVETALECNGLFQLFHEMKTTPPQWLIDRISAERLFSCEDLDSLTADLEACCPPAADRAFALFVERIAALDIKPLLNIADRGLGSERCRQAWHAELRQPLRQEQLRILVESTMEEAAHVPQVALALAPTPASSTETSA